MRRATTDRAEAVRRAAALCQCTDVDDPRVRARLASAEAMAVALMYDPIIWKAIELTAKALERNSFLSGRDVQLLLREAKR